MPRKNSLLSVLPIITVLLTGGSALQAYGADGANSGGGGAQLESAFRLRAKEIITKIADIPAANAICPATVMDQALRKTSIRIVDQLLNPRSGLPINDRNLDAWTVPGDMQLKNVSWSLFLNIKSASINDRSIDALIIHEIFRATGNRCDDENFKISNDVMSALNQPSDKSLIFRFTSGTKITERPLEIQNYIVCDQRPVALGQKVVCAGIANQFFVWRATYADIGVFEDSQGTRNSCDLLFLSPELYPFYPTMNADYRRLVNFMHLVSPERPLYVIFDTQEGSMSYGFDLNHLHTLKN